MIEAGNLIDTASFKFVFHPKFSPAVPKVEIISLWNDRIYPNLQAFENVFWKLFRREASYCRKATLQLLTFLSVSSIVSRQVDIVSHEIPRERF